MAEELGARLARAQQPLCALFEKAGVLLDQQHPPSGPDDDEGDVAKYHLRAFGTRPVQAVIDRPCARQGLGELRQGGAFATTGAGGGELFPAFRVSTGHVVFGAWCVRRCSAGQASGPALPMAAV